MSDFEDQAGADTSEGPEPIQPGDRAGSVRDPGDRQAAADRRQRDQDRADRLDVRRSRRTDHGDRRPDNVAGSPKLHSLLASLRAPSCAQSAPPIHQNVTKKRSDRALMSWPT